MEKINEINNAIKDYFAQNKSVNEIRAKNLMPLFIKRGIFERDIKGGLPIRELLRELDTENRLGKIPNLRVDRKQTNRNWFFVRSNSLVL